MVARSNVAESPAPGDTGFQDLSIRLVSRVTMAAQQNDVLGGLRQVGIQLISLKTKAGFLNFSDAHLINLGNVPSPSAHADQRLPSALRGHTRWPQQVMNRALPFLLSLACVGAVTGVLLPFDAAPLQGLVPIIYLIPVIMAATRWGIGPAAVASIASVCAADFFFLPPVYSFRVDDPQEAIDLLLFMVVALVSGNLAARLRHETERLRRREHEVQSLYEFSRRLATCFSVSDLIGAVQYYLSRSLGLNVVFYPAATETGLESTAAGSLPQKIRQTIAAMLATASPVHETTQDEAVGDVWLLRTVLSEGVVHGVIAVNIGNDLMAVTDKTRNAVEAVLEEAAATLRHMDIGTAMHEARLYTRTQLLKDALHGTLSHEMRSPLSTIQGSASVLNTIPAIRDDNRTRLLVEAILDEVERLDGFIGNLVSATRVTADGVRPRRLWTDPRDIVNGALHKRARRLLHHKVQSAFSEDVPLVEVDAVLVEEAFGQLLENAAKYSPAGSTIVIAIRVDEQTIDLSVTDQGFGITADEKRQLGRKSFRGERHHNKIPGSGLGFWIAKTFIDANGGDIDVASLGEGRGTRASILLPVDKHEAATLALMADE